jgi:hypothetical protein
MQPRTAGSKTQCLIELKATVPECIHNMIKAVPGGPVIPVIQNADSVAFLLRSNNSAVATYFD